MAASGYHGVARKSITRRSWSALTAFEARRPNVAVCQQNTGDV
jgi:hypothetical protein